MAFSESDSSSSSSPLKLRVTNRAFVKASDASRKPYILPVSNLDLVPVRHPAAIIFIYSKPRVADFESVLTVIKKHLPNFLNPFFPLAGRIVKNQSSNRPEILCNNDGAELVEAEAGIPLIGVNFADTSKSLDKILMLSSADNIGLTLVVLKFTCGGYATAWCGNHLIVDAYSLSRLACSWAEFICTGKIAKAPNFDRSIFQPRSPAKFNPTVDPHYTTFTTDNLINVLSAELVPRGVYYVTASDLDRLQALASRTGGRKATRTEAFAAHVWMLLAAVVGESDSACAMGWYVDCRRRMGRANIEALESYVGNGHSAVVKEASVKRLRESELPEVAQMVSDAIKEVGNEDHFVDLINWVELHDKELVVHRKKLGHGTPAIFISPCHGLPVESDFGFGKASLAIFHGVGSERFANGFMSTARSPTGDGSWIVSAALWPRLAKVLQLDSVCPLRPITPEYLLGLAGKGADQRMVSRM